MTHPVPVGPQALDLASDRPPCRLGVEAHRGTIELRLASTPDAPQGWQWTQNGEPVPGQSGLSLLLGGLTVDDSDLFFATWTDATGTPQRSQAALVVVYPGHGLANQSVRGPVATDRPLTAGFVVARGIGPVRPKRYLIRVIGPSLARFQVPQPLRDPVVSLSRRTRDCQGLLSIDPASIAACSQAVGAFAIDPAAGDFAAVADLPPGVYSLTVRPSAATSSGEVLIEIYETTA